jgi:ketol-acid reductoisomerase
MELLRDADIDPAPLAGKRVAVLGFGNQGRAQALNLNDSGIDIVVGLRRGSQSEAGARGAGLEVAELADAVTGRRPGDDAGAGRSAGKSLSNNRAAIARGRGAGL